jgi:hypothetical protein
MRLQLLTTLAILGLPISSAFAIDPSPEGTVATVAVKLTVRDETKSDWASANLNHVLDAQCVMRAGPASQVGRGGMSAEQEAAAAQSQANVQAFEENFAPSDDMLAQMEAEMAACGDDEACMTAVAMKLAQTPEMQAMAQKMPEAKAAMAGLTPDMGPARYQLWMPESCSGTVTIQDTYFESDPGGEGGDGAYADNITANGSAPLPADWKFMVMEADLVAGATSYQIMRPLPVAVETQGSYSGKQLRQIEFLGSAALPEWIGPVPGIATGSTRVQGASGTLDAAWSTVK